MGKILDRRQTVSLEDMVLAQAFQLEALMNVLERYGLLKNATCASRYVCPSEVARYYFCVDTQVGGVRYSYSYK